MNLNPQNAGNRVWACREYDKLSVINKRYEVLYPLKHNQSCVGAGLADLFVKCENRDLASHRIHARERGLCFYCLRQ
jgi:hypothetical protein